MRLIDTHCHLTHGRLRPDVDAVLTRARQAGVAAFVCAAGDLPESKAALGLAHQQPDVYCMAGVHPHDAKDAGGDYLARIEHMAADGKNVAVGEIGLDYHYNYSPPTEQRRVFAEQLDLARRLGKPAVIHTREAFADTMDLVERSGVAPAGVVFHSCTEPPANARRILDWGANISFSGIVTFRGATDLHATAKLVPAERMLIETDCPFLSPEPVRKMKTNEPANVAHVARFLADLLGRAPRELAERTAANAARVFGLAIDG